MIIAKHGKITLLLSVFTLATLHEITKKDDVANL